jgi:predicted nucleotidyltransferase
MGKPTAAEFRQRLGESYALDRLWRETMGLLPGDTKEGPLRQVVSVLEATRTRYALIGGVAVQLYSEEPRTTLDIDLAVATFAEIPAAALTAAGFEHEQRFAHSDNWRAPGDATRRERTAIQFSAEDVGIAAAIEHAARVDIGGLTLCLATPEDLVVLKLVAAEEGTRRMRKRRQDYLDILTVLEEHPDAAAKVPELKERLERLRAVIMAVSLG